MKLHYIWDAYCGWCYGFGPALNEFAGHHPELDISVTSGGLFVEDRIQPVSQFGFMKAGNEQIKAIYGSEFSDTYNDLLDEGSTVINSNHPATALSVLKKYVAPRAAYRIRSRHAEAVLYPGQKSERYSHLCQPL